MISATVFIITVILMVILLVLLFRSVYQEKATKVIQEGRRQSLEAQMSRIQKERDQYLEEKIQLGRTLTGQQAHTEALTQKLEKQASDLERIQDAFRKEFENLANRLLDEKSEKFTRQNQSNIEGLLKPLQERIREFEQKVNDTYNQESRERFNLQKELNRMFELNQTLSEQANNLALALKADTKRQGNWGEFLLERVLETSGLEEGIHYKKQFSKTDEQGTVKRPDVVILLPESRYVVIDAKVSLTAYERYCSSGDDEVRQRALRDHLQSIRNHIEELSRKNYEQLFERSADFVLMFIPVEPAYGLALMRESSLFADAFRKNIILVSVSSLLATLRIIDAMWRLEKQNRNATEIVRQGSQLYDKFAGFAEDMLSLGQKLQGAQNEFDLAINKLSQGKGNLVRRAEQMRLLGLDNRKQLPTQWIHRGAEQMGDAEVAVTDPGLPG